MPPRSTGGISPSSRSPQRSTDYLDHLQRQRPNAQPLTKSGHAHGSRLFPPRSTAGLPARDGKSKPGAPSKAKQPQSSLSINLITAWSKTAPNPSICSRSLSLASGSIAWIPHLVNALISLAGSTKPTSARYVDRPNLYSLRLKPLPRPFIGLAWHGIQFAISSYTRPMCDFYCHQPHFD